MKVLTRHKTFETWRTASYYDEKRVLQTIGLRVSWVSKRKPSNLVVTKLKRGGFIYKIKCWLRDRGWWPDVPSAAETEMLRRSNVRGAFYGNR